MEDNVVSQVSTNICYIDLAEEVKHASRTVPRMMVVTIILNGALGLIMVVTYCFCVADVEAMYVTTVSPFPFIDVGKSHISCPISSR